MKKTNKGFSIVMAMGIVILINLIAINILDYVIPFSNDTKNIENSVVSYYQADSAIEDALYYISKDTYVLGTESGTSLTSNPISNSFQIIASGSLLPRAGDGSSDYDKNWDKIAIGNPIQLEIGYNKVAFNNAEFAFRVPNLDNANPLTLSGGNTLAIINWQISSSNNTINATAGNYIFSDNICKSDEDFSDCPIDLSLYQGVDLDGNQTLNERIWDFYDDNCKGAGSGCILKLSVVNKLEDNSDNISIPYLEWQFSFTGNVPLRYSIIETDGKAYGYKKSLKVKVPQQTTNEAFDFTVFQ